MSKSTAYEVHGVGPNQGTMRIDLPHVVNVLTGQNGAGKTLAMQAICRAAGDESAEVVKNDGADAAWVQGPGVVLKTGGKRITVRGGSDDLALGYGKIHELLDPPGKTAKTKDNNRAKALLGFYRDPVTQETVKALCGGDETIAGGVMSELARRVGAGGITLEEAAKRSKLFIELLAQSREADAQEHAAIVLVAKRREEEIKGELAGYDRPDGDVEMLTEDVSERTAELGGLDVERKVRVAKEEERERARGLQDKDRPDVAVAIVANAEAQQEMHKLRLKLITACSVAKDAQTREVEETLAANKWDERQEILGEPIEGPEAADVEIAERELSDKMADLEALRLYEEMDRQTLARENSMALQDIEAEKAHGFRVMAKGVLAEVNKILGKADFGGLLLDSEMGLSYSGPETGGEIVPFEHLSEGEGARAVLTGVAVTRYPDKMIPLSRAWWWSLQPERMRDMVRLAMETGVRYVTELPTDSPGIEVVGLGEDWLESDLRAETWIESLGRTSQGVA